MLYICFRLFSRRRAARRDVFVRFLVVELLAGMFSSVFPLSSCSPGCFRLFSRCRAARRDVFARFPVVELLTGVFFLVGLLSSVTS
jgi:prepilin signal peptidase PulO-like enzyme (type II secretory pathway)